MNKKKIIAFIPARGGSKGVKLKNLHSLGKKPLLAWSIEAAKKAKVIDRIFVSTDHKKIVNCAKKYGAEIHNRPKKHASDWSTTYDTIKDFYYYMNKNLNYKPDIIIVLEPTSPFRKKKDLKKSCLEIVKQKKYSCWSVNKVSKKYHPKKLLINSKSNLKLYEKNGEKIIARQQLGEIFQRNGIFYIFNVQQLLKEKKIYLKKTIFHEINYPYVNIDTIEDLSNTKKLAKKFKFND